MSMIMRKGVTMMNKDNYQAIANDAITILFHLSRNQPDKTTRKLARTLQERYEKILVEGE